MASTSSASVSVPVNADAFGFIRDLLHRESKICIEEDQDYLVDTRLAPIAQEQGVSSVNELVDILRRQPTTSLIASIVDALTTNETSFFRDKPFFETLEQTVFPFIRDTYNELGRASMWCAASSSGQEIYSILMLMQEKLADVPLESVRFLATDLSPTMIERVRDGSYSQHEVSRGLPTRYLTKYFKRQGVRWQVTDELRGVRRDQRPQPARALAPDPQLPRPPVAERADLLRAGRPHGPDQSGPRATRGAGFSVPRLGRARADTNTRSRADRVRTVRRLSPHRRSMMNSDLGHD